MGPENTSNALDSLRVQGLYLLSLQKFSSKKCWMQEEMGSTSSTALHYKTSGHIIFFYDVFIREAVKSGETACMALESDCLHPSSAAY